MNEQQLTLLVERVGDALEPDVQTLVVGGRDRGRVRRRRRAVGSVLVGAVAVGAVALTGVLLPRGTDAAPVVSDPPPPSRQLAVSPADMSTVLASLLAGARVVEKDDEPYEYQRQRGEVRWHGTLVTVTIDSRSVGTSASARERCEAFQGGACVEAPGDAWVADVRGTVEVDTRTGEQGRSLDSVRVYLRDGFVIEAAADHAQPRLGPAVLRGLALDGVWLR